MRSEQRLQKSVKKSLQKHEIKAKSPTDYATDPELGTPNDEQGVDPPQSDARVTIDTETVARLALLAREELLTLSEVERILKTKRTSVWRMRNREKNPLPSIVIDGVPRVKRGELQDWINSHKKQ